MLNRVVVYGYLGQQPEVKTSKMGNSYLAFDVITERRPKDGQPPKQDVHKCLAFGETAQKLGTLHEGSKVILEGCLNYEQVKAKSGDTFMQTKIICQVVDVVLDLVEESKTTISLDALFEQQQQESPADGGVIITNEDIPF